MTDAMSTGSLLRSKFAGDHPRYIENVFDQLGLRLRVAINGFQGARRGGLVEVTAAKQMRPTDELRSAECESRATRSPKTRSFMRLAVSASARAICSPARASRKFFLDLPPFLDLGLKRSGFLLQRAIARRRCIMVRPTPA